MAINHRVHHLSEVKPFGAVDGRKSVTTQHEVTSNNRGAEARKVTPNRRYSYCRTNVIMLLMTERKSRTLSSTWQTGRAVCMSFTLEGHGDHSTHPQQRQPAKGKASLLFFLLEGHGDHYLNRAVQWGRVNHGVMMDGSTTGVLMSPGYAGFQTVTPPPYCSTTTCETTGTTSPRLQCTTTFYNSPCYYTDALKYNSALSYTTKELEYQRELSSFCQQLDCSSLNHFIIMGHYAEAPKYYTTKASEYHNLRFAELLHRCPELLLCLELHHQDNGVHTTTYAALSDYTEAPKYYCVPSYYTEAPATFSTKTSEYYTEAPKYYSAPIYTATAKAVKHYAAPTYYTEAAPSYYVEQKCYTDSPVYYTPTGICVQICRCSYGGNYFSRSPYGHILVFGRNSVSGMA
ncbi:hypothetical protein DAPPUDRAFT_243622 [Daphnia pulex]|uniref:Uncharacterized protein n=1 Tax=Daphnia pulex TaxID=6669 RepID=E9GJ89_DAPPU|nr:hypothetical protein DAPPUDRAFT_243622 [Daphnia pulex]|eukprot:EFX80405.1 hypothetical protein DAPPUDRAFT_243622 [Daphnia pulex]